MQSIQLPTHELKHNRCTIYQTNKYYATARRSQWIQITSIAYVNLLVSHAHICTLRSVCQHHSTSARMWPVLSTMLTGRQQVQAPAAAVLLLLLIFLSFVILPLILLILIIFILALFLAHVMNMDPCMYIHIYMNIVPVTNRVYIRAHE